MTKTRALVSGAAGFLGSHLCEALLNSDYSVVGIDNLSQGTVANLSECMSNPNFTFEEADVRDASALNRVGQLDLVVHLAAFKIPRYGGRINTLDVNVLGARSVLERARRDNAQVIVASTSDVYGKSDAIPFVETGDSVLGPAAVARWAYAVSKLYTEHLCMAYMEEYGLVTSALRYFGSYGPRNHRSWWGGPQSVFIERCLAGEGLPVHGDGCQTRSFTYVSDTIAGTMAVVHADRAKTAGQVFNVGSAEEISILNLARTIWRLIRPTEPPKIELVPYESFTGRYEDVRRRVPNTTKLRDLGWEPRVTLEDGLRRAIDWHRAG